jgi:hypothetical protein
MFKRCTSGNREMGNGDSEKGKKVMMYKWGWVCWLRKSVICGSTGQVNEIGEM